MILLAVGIPVLLVMLGFGLLLFRVLLTTVRTAVADGMMNPMLFGSLLSGLSSRKRIWPSNGPVRNENVRPGRTSASDYRRTLSRRLPASSSVSDVPVQ
jgi:hypothetical protein